MGQRFTEEQLEQMIMQLEQGGLLQAPPSLERGVMEKIARLEEENQADIRFSSKTKRIFYQSLSICSTSLHKRKTTGSIAYDDLRQLCGAWLL